VNVKIDFRNVKFHISFIDCGFFPIPPVEIESDIMYIAKLTKVLLIDYVTLCLKYVKNK